MVVIYGPPGSGKTSYAERFRQHYRCARIVDEFGTLDHEHRDLSIRRDDLVLTQLSGNVMRRQFPRARLIPISSALRAIGVDRAQ